MSTRASIIAQPGANFIQPAWYMPAGQKVSLPTGHVTSSIRNISFMRRMPHSVVISV